MDPLPHWHPVRQGGYRLTLDVSAIGGDLPVAVFVYGHDDRAIPPGTAQRRYILFEPADHGFEVLPKRPVGAADQKTMTFALAKDGPDWATDEANTAALDHTIEVAGQTRL